MKEIPEEVQKTLEKCYNDFQATTEEPKSVIRDSTGQFIGVGKLKFPTYHHDSNADVVTTRIVFFNRWVRCQGIPHRPYQRGL
jgi:hypothetical protein